MDLKPLIAALSSILALLLIEFDVSGERLVGKQISAPSLSLVLALLGVAVRQGASLPRAMSVVGGLLPGPYGLRMVRVAHLLGRGNGWDLSWSGAIGDPDYGQSMQVLADCLEPSWRLGSSPLARIETTMRQLHRHARSVLARVAATITVRLLVPTGLCILPAFVLIGVIPCIAAFAGGMS
ncbi:pilus assembly protein [Bifidobacterium asteroides]|uniref:pilus assembly protein n=1 Tax=Bifidobacterium asteroides TaxID=1684 RepID=UPI003A80C160